MEDRQAEIKSVTTSMRGQKINRVSGIGLIVLSLTALLTVLNGFTQPPQPPPPDEEAAAHIFQLSIVALVPTIILFLATADWRLPGKARGPWHFQPPLSLSRLPRSITWNTTGKLRHNSRSSLIHD